MTIHWLTQGRPNTVTRPVGFPKMVSPLPSNPGGWYDDFLQVSTTTTLGTGGDWLVTLKGNAGTYGYGGSSTTQGSVGQFTLSSGAVATGDGYIVDKNARNAAVSTAAITSNGQGNLLVRMSFGTTRTNVLQGGGFVATSLAEGTDWVSDPATTLAGTNSLVVTRTSADGHIYARLFDTAPTAVSLKMVDTADVGSNQYSFEFSRPASSLVWNCYSNGVLIGTLSHSSAAIAMSMRPSFGVITQTSAGTRVVNVDAMATESSLTTAR